MLYQAYQLYEPVLGHVGLEHAPLALGVVPRQHQHHLLASVDGVRNVLDDRLAHLDD